MNEVSDEVADQFYCIFKMLTVCFEKILHAIGIPQVDKVVVGTKRKKLAKYDVFLKRFQYTEAFDSVIAVSYTPCSIFLSSKHTRGRQVKITFSYIF